MNKNISTFLNPINWFKAYQYHKQNANYDKSSYDLELYLYSKILKNDMLHWGYFEDINIAPDAISVRDVEEAQMKYAENIMNLIDDKQGLVLDVGCGMGGLSAMLKQNGINVEALTPNVNQKTHIETKYKGLICHHAKFEDFKSEQKYNTIINSESLQYINLDIAIEHVDKFMDIGGRWIIVDYFRKNQDGINKSGHLEENFLSKIANKGWKITYEKDITLNVLPMSKFIYMYADRFLIPLKHFAFEKLRFKKAWLYYLTENLRSGIDKKMTKEFAAIDPEKFLREKKYAMYVVERN
ncbi:MAG: methyltransferase domain-containing protein [Bacteroidia bacterium]|nr:methyltransferase domain-containing protein [Bacteroidia bacterium]